MGRGRHGRICNHFAKRRATSSPHLGSPPDQAPHVLSPSPQFRLSAGVPSTQDQPRAFRSASGDCTQMCPAGDTACGQLTCGTGKCTATCGGLLGACDSINCGNSCQCDVSCDDMSNICPNTMTCPQPPGGQNQCESTITGACTSSKTPNKCQKCM